MPSSRRTKRGNDDDVPDEQKTVVEWEKCTLEILRLKCQANSLLATGRKAELASRLFDHFHPETLENVLNEIPDEVISEDGEHEPEPVGDGNGNDVIIDNNNNSNSNSTLTIPWPQSNDDQELRNYVDARLNDVMQELAATRSELKATRNKQAVVEHENLALRSQLRALKENRPSSDSNIVSSGPSRQIHNNINTTSIRASIRAPTTTTTNYTTQSECENSGEGMVVNSHGNILFTPPTTQPATAISNPTLVERRIH